MGICARVNNDPGRFFARLLYPVDKFALMVALPKIDFKPVLISAQC